MSIEVTRVFQITDLAESVALTIELENKALQLSGTHSVFTYPAKLSRMHIVILHLKYTLQRLH